MQRHNDDLEHELDRPSVAGSNEGTELDHKSADCTLAKNNSRYVHGVM